MKKTALLLLLTLINLLSCAPTPKPGKAQADLIIIATRIHTLDPKQPQARALAITGERILAVGQPAEIMALNGPGTVVIKGTGTVYPGLIDAHAHVASLGSSLEIVDLRGTRSFTELADRVKRRAATLPAGAWVTGRSWDQNLWPGKAMPTHEQLSALTPNHPVWLKRVDGHAAIANQKAMTLAGIDRNTPDPEGGKLLRQPGGELSGVFIDNAMDLITEVIPKPTTADLERQLLLAQQACFAAGLTRVHDAWTKDTVKGIMQRLEKNGRWQLGIYGMYPPTKAGSPPPQPDDGGPRSRLRFRALKIFADGALGSRGAALFAPYHDQPGNVGLLTTPAKELRRLVRLARDQNLQPCVHAIGDRANRLMLDIYAQELSAADRKRIRPRIEHAQVLNPTDLPRFAALGVTASMQPTHLTTDMSWAAERLGPKRIAGTYAFGTLINLGVRVPFGSDFPVETHAPLRGLFAAVTTRSPENPKAPPFRPDQRVSPYQALVGFTLEAARAAFEEEVRGRIIAGYQADLTILDQDILKCAPQKIRTAKVLATIVGGKVVYRP